MRGRADGVGVGVFGAVNMLWRAAGPELKHRLAYVLVLVGAGGMVSALTPAVLRGIVDGLATRGMGPSVRMSSLVMLYVLTLWLARTMNQVREMAFARARESMVRSLSEQLFSHLMRLPLRFHLDRQTGAVSETLDSGLEGIRIILHHLVFTYLPVTVELSTVLVVLVRLFSTRFLLLFGGAVVCYLVVFGYSAVAVSKSARRASAARVDAAAVMLDGLLNYEIIKYFTAETVVQRRVSSALSRAESEWVGFYRMYALNGSVAAVIFAGFLATTTYFATDEVRQGRMTIGDFVLVNSYMLQIVQPIELVGYATQALSRGMAMLERLMWLFREPTEEGAHATKRVASMRGSVEFRDVCVSYGLGRPVLKNVSFQVTAGATLGVVGPSGSGKSTIVRLLMRLLEPESGTILLDGEPIRTVALQDLRHLIAVVPQETVLFDETLGYNIAFGRAGASVEEIKEAARIAQLHEFIMRLPDRYDTLVGERGMKLSGGERQRVSIARAVLKSPRIFVFDEATSSLDSHAEQEILQSLRIISKSKTTLVIAHRLSTIVHADEIVMLENGHVIEHGTHHALLCRKGRYAALWEAQQRGAVAA